MCHTSILGNGKLMVLCKSNQLPINNTKPIRVRAVSIQKGKIYILCVMGMENAVTIGGIVESVVQKVRDKGGVSYVKHREELVAQSEGTNQQ